MITSFTKRMLREVPTRLLWKAGMNLGLKGARSVHLFRRRLKRGVWFPPFLFISVTSSCQLRCKGCWVDVEGARQMLSVDEATRLITQAKDMGNSCFGLLGGEPLLHPHLQEIMAAHRDCYFQVLTNGHLIDDEVAAGWARLGNVSPLISIEGSSVISDERRGRLNVLDRSLTGVEACRQAGLITGVATSVCRNNIELVSERWLRELISRGVHYAWFHVYRPVGPAPCPELALSPEQMLQLRRAIVELRRRLPIVIIEPYWDAQGRAVCPMSLGMSHHIGPGGHIEPCPVIQFAAESIRDGDDSAQLIAGSAFLDDFRRTSATATPGCVLLERPDLVRELVLRHGARDSTQRGTALAELEALVPTGSQHTPGRLIAEEHWPYRLAKKYWFFGLGACT